MANTVQRGSRMNHTLMVRVTEEDKVALELESQRTGMNTSQLIRGLLIKEKIISPSYPSLI
jgi:hypothetical protein